MFTTRLYARLAAVAATFAASLLISVPAPLKAQQPAAADKLDAVVQERAAQGGGRSRVIVRFGTRTDARAITERRGRARGRLEAQRALVAEIDNAELEALAADPRVERVMIDRPVFPTLFRTGAAVGATLARQEFGLTGQGIGVVVIDSGVAAWHNDLYLADGVTRLDGRVAHFKDFTGTSTSPDAVSDEYGHGTHVAATIAGSGFDSGGARSGIAPGAHLIVFKVLDADGHGYISDVIAAIDYAVAMKDVFNIRVINLSVASGVFESYRHDPLAQAARRAVAAGIVVVTAAGNLGATEDGAIQYGGVTSPGNDPSVITVGASSHQGTARRSDDVVAAFSSRGPTWIDFAAKPDLVAPGVGTESAVDPSSTLALAHPDYLLPGTQATGGTPYLSLSGTSMSAPVVAGTVALMLEANPALTPNAVKAILQYTAQPLEGESPLAQGAGLLNTLGAIRLARFFASPGVHPIAVPEADLIEGEVVAWAQHVIWGNHRVAGGLVLPRANAWTLGLPWGATATVGNSPVSWGVRFDQQITPTAGGRNIVWATGGGRNIVWATRGGRNIVWATSSGRDTVWASSGGRNIVWATGGGRNIVWATDVAENVVWGEECGGRNCTNVIWGVAVDARASATSGGRNIVWATAGGRNIVWATGGGRNIVWATGGGRNIVWATGGSRNIVWATSGGRNIVWATGASADEEVVGTSAAPDRVIWPAVTQ
jgi:subtilisin family serine protease